MLLHNLFEKLDEVCFQKILDYVHIKIGRDRFELGQMLFTLSCIICMFRWLFVLCDFDQTYKTLLSATIGFLVVFILTAAGCVYANLLKSAHRHAVMFLPELRFSMTMAILILLFLRILLVWVDVNNPDLSSQVIFDELLSILMWIIMFFAINLLACNFFGRSEFDKV